MGDEPRECGCPFPKDYPNIDIHISTCKYRRQPKDLSVATREKYRKSASGRKLHGSDAPIGVTPTHQTFWSHEYTHIIHKKQGSVWIAMAKRFDNKHNKG